jgi:hypothetical protein
MSNEITTKEQVVAIVQSVLEEYEISVDETQVIELIRPHTSRLDAIEQRLATLADLEQRFARVESALSISNHNNPAQEERLNTTQKQEQRQSTKARVKVKIQPQPQSI